MFKRSGRTYTTDQMERVTFPRHLQALWTPVAGGSRIHAVGWKIKAPAALLDAAVTHANELLGES